MVRPSDGRPTQSFRERILKVPRLKRLLQDRPVLYSYEGRSSRTRSDKIVVHDIEALHALSFGHELFLCRTVVDEDYIRVAAPPDVERLAVPTATTLQMTEKA